jgi:periplasmic protein TonB
MLSNNEQNEQKSRIAALTGTLLFHALILVGLILLAFRTDFPLPAEEGVEVNFDYSGLEIDNLNNDSIQLAHKVELIADHQNAVDDINIERTEETPIIKKKDSDKPNTQKTRISIIETPYKSTLIHRTPNSEKTAKTTTTANQTNSANPVNHTKPNEATPNPANENSLEKGGSISFDLSGRAARFLPKPTFNSSVDGKIVVTIKVNIEGKIISASAGAKGTTITEPNLRKQAENAAHNSLFTRDINAPEDQRGTITYVIVKEK